MNIHHTSSLEQFTGQSVSLLEQSIQNAISDRGSCVLGLAGGNTPKTIYTELGKKDIDWNTVTVFLIDERYIDPSHDDSNQKMVRETLLSTARIPESNVVFPDTTLPLADCIEKYITDLSVVINHHGPDVITVGMGHDGHISSLFPPLHGDTLGDQALAIHTTTELFAVFDRIAVNLDCLGKAKEAVFLLKGEDKKIVWGEMMASDEDELRWPAKRILENSKVGVVTLW